MEDWTRGCLTEKEPALVLEYSVTQTQLQQRPHLLGALGGPHSTQLGQHGQHSPLGSSEYWGTG